MSQDRLFLLNPQNTDILTDGYKHPSSRNNILSVVMMLLCVAICLLTVLFVATNILNWTNLNQEGIVVEGKLIDRFETTSRRQTSPTRTVNIYYWRYSYTTLDGQRLEGEVQVEEEAYTNDYQPNATVQVLYLPDNPTTSRILRDSVIDFPRIQTFIGGIVFVFFGLCAFIFWRVFNQNRQYRTNGKLIYGKVDSAKLTVGESKGKRVAILYLNYEFTSPITGKQIVKFTNRQRNDLQEQDLPAMGTPIAIFYANDRIFKIL